MPPGIPVTCASSAIPIGCWSFLMSLEGRTGVRIKGAGEDPKIGSSEERKRTNIEHRTSNVEHRMNEFDELNKPNKLDEPNELKQQTSASEIPDRDERSGFHRANKPSVRATFFILGWIAERLPGLVREIHDRGHEVASHGYGHEMCSRQSPEALKADLVKSKHLLEDIIGADVCGYRAPSFSVDNDILKIIEDAGYGYDSSYNSFDKHGRYGKLFTNGFQRKGIAYQVSDTFHELPISNLCLKPIADSQKPVVLPFSGGGYFRLIPDMVFNTGVRSILEKEDGYLFYMHPWEIDPAQPRVSQASAFFKFRHYVNLHRTEGKLKRMIGRFGDCRFVTCRDYIGKVIE